MADALSLFDVPDIGSADAPATQAVPRPPSESVDGQESFRPLPTAGDENAAAGFPQARPGRGRPRGSRYPDAQVIQEMHRMLPSVPTLRHAARLMAPHAHRYGHAEPESTVRRLERRYRAERST
jgi:hypothetical protein